MNNSFNAVQSCSVSVMMIKTITALL